MAVHPKKWLLKDFSASGDTTLITGVSGQRIFVKHIIFSVDSETDIKLQDSNNTDLTCRFQFGSYGAMYSLDGTALNILLGRGLDLVINSSNAVDGSLMIDYQMVTDQT